MQQQEPQPNPNRRMAGWMITGVWLLVFGLLTLFFQNYLEKERNPNRNVAALTADNGAREVILQRNRFGHYNVTGKINGRPVEFLLDTGATHIAIPSGVAKRLGLSRLYETNIHTANGNARAYGTKLDLVSVGPIALSDRKAMITPGMTGEVVLLGMGFLKDIEFTQRGDLLILRQYPDR